MMIFRNKRRVGITIALASAVVFGIWPTATRGVYANGGNVTFVLLLTTWARTLSMGGFCLLTRRALFRTREDIRQAAIGGFVQMISVVGMYMALEFLSGPIVMIIVFSHTIMLLFYMAWRGEIKLDAYTVATTIVALGGLSLVLDIWHGQSSSSWIGIGLSFMAALATVSRLYVFGHQTKARHPIVVGAEVFLAAAIFMNLMLFYQMPHMPTTMLGGGYAALGCVSVTVGTFAMFYGISLLGSFQWSLLLKLEPVFTAIFAALLLNEILKPGQYLGIAVVLCSLVLYQIVEHRRRMAASKIDAMPIQ